MEHLTVPRWARRLVTTGALEDERLTTLAADAAEHGQELDRLLVDGGIVPEETVGLCKALEMDVPYVDPRLFDIDPANAELVPEALARSHQLFPLFAMEGLIVLGMREPGDLAVIDQVRLRTRCEVDPVLCPATALEAIVERVYCASETEPGTVVEEPTTLHDDTNLGANKVVRLVRSMVEKSVRAGASDIHVEPERDASRVRIRVDGVLHELATHPVALHAPIVSRIKVESRLDIAETRKPQDGHFSLALPQGRVDIRVSSLPTVHGENVVMRLLPTGDQFIGLDDLAIPRPAHRQLEDCLDNPHGLILVTGPTGSGKTTTLYAALDRLNTVERNVVTVEDPVEKRIPRLRQTAVNPKAGVTFASGLRSILRQDPDVIMIGEIRDRETAEIAIQAALTGHLVLSTLHTNTAAGAVVRLSEMGVAPFMITSSVQAVLAQRLVRRLCEQCREVEPANARLARALGWVDAPDGLTLPVGRGCTRCLQTGFKGRVGVYEMIHLTDGLRRALLRDDSRDAIESESREALVCDMRSDGLDKVRRGLTTLDEVARVAGVATRSHEDEPT